MSDNNPLISVIVPVYNAQQFLDKCVNSIITQTYSNLELILVDDGSTDDSYSKCLFWKQKDSRIKVFHQNNRGASAARNLGLCNYCGEYVVFVDSDDYVSPNYLENLIIACKEDDYDIVQCNIREVKSTKIQDSGVKYSASDLRCISKTQALNERYYKVSICGKIYFSDILKDFRFREGIIYEDDDSYYKFIFKANKLAVLNETLYYYYLSENSVMRNDKKDKSVAFIKIYHDRIEYFKNEPVLLDGTYSRYCLVLLLTFSSFLVHHTNKNDRKMLLNEFKLYYKMVLQSTNICIKEKLLYACFRIMPYLTGTVIGVLRG